MPVPAELDSEVKKEVRPVLDEEGPTVDALRELNDSAPAAIIGEGVEDPIATGDETGEALPGAVLD